MDVPVIHGRVCDPWLRMFVRNSMIRYEMADYKVGCVLLL